METFQIKASSLGIYLLTLFIIFFAGSSIGIFFLPTKGNPLIAITLTIVIMFISLYATRFTARAMTQWTLTDSEIQLKWLNQFIFHHEADLIIKWNDIQEYKYRPDQYFDLFKIKLNDGKILKLRHSSTATNDDFENFILVFETKVQAYNLKATNPPNEIKRGKTVYETKLGFVLAILTGLLLIALLIFIIASPHKQNANLFGLVVAYSGGIFFISQVLLYRKKKSSR